MTYSNEEEIFFFLEKNLKNNLENYPDNNNIFKWFNFCEINEIKVVSIGQDPYHGPGQAT